MSELRDLFTIKEPVAPPNSQTYSLGGKVHSSVVMMEVNGTRFGSAAQFAHRPYDSDWNQWAYPVDITNVDTFNVACAVSTSNEVTFISEDAIYNYSDTDIQIGLDESLSNELQLATDMYNAGQLTAGQLACVSNELSLSSVLGEYSASGEWIDTDYLSDIQLSIRGWKEGRGPFGYTNASTVVTSHPDANTFLNNAMQVNSLASNDYIESLVADGYTTGDRLWTHLFRSEFSLGEDYISTTDLSLVLEYEGAIEVFLNGASVYRDNMKCSSTFPWGFSEYATARSDTTTTVDLSSYTSLVQQGTNTIGIALKTASKTDDSAFVSAKLEGSIWKYQWSDPKQVTLELSDGTQTEELNFNSLDNFGLMIDMERLPGEHNVDYKERMLNSLDPELPSNSTILGLLNGISHNLGLPIDTTAITIEANDLSEKPNNKIVTGMTVYTRNNYFYFTADQFIKSNEQLTIDSNYPIATISKTVDRLIKITDADGNIINDALYTTSHDGTEIEINSDLSSEVLYATYQYAERIDMTDISIQDVVLFINSILFGTSLVATATVSEEFFPEIYRGTCSTAGTTYIDDNINVENLNLPSPSYINLVDAEKRRKVSSISDERIYFEGSSLGTYTDVEYTLNYCPSAFFIPRTRFEENDNNTLYIPLYQVRLDRINKDMLEKYSNVYQGQLNDVGDMIQMIRDSMHVTWDEQVVDFDMWDAIDNFLMSNSEIPGLYDMPKQAFTTTTTDMMSPDEFRLVGDPSNDYVAHFFNSNDFVSGVGSIDDYDSPINHRDDLALSDIVVETDGWRPKLKTGYFYIRDREYYLFDNKECKWINDLTWVKIPVPYTTANNGQSVQPKVQAVSITHNPTSFVVPSTYIQIKDDYIWLNMSFLNPEGSPGYTSNPFNCTVNINYTYYDLVGQSMSLNSSGVSTVNLLNLDRVYVMDPLPTDGAPIVLTDLNASPSSDYTDRHPQFSVDTEGAIEFLDSKIDHQNVVFEWESGSGEYYISDRVDYNPANNPESTGFLAIENDQSSPIGEEFDGPGGVL